MMTGPSISSDSPSIDPRRNIQRRQRRSLLIQSYCTGLFTDEDRPALLGLFGRHLVPPAVHLAVPSTGSLLPDGLR